MDKKTVRKLRRRRAEFVSELIKTESIMRESHPEVAAYLDAKQNEERASLRFSDAWMTLRQDQREELIPEFWHTAQLQLPKDTPKPKRRDMSMKEFEAALERRGFLDVGQGALLAGAMIVGVVMRWKNGQYEIDRRETLKRAIAALNE